MTDQRQLRFPYLLFDLGSTLIYFDGDWPEVIIEAIHAATRYLRSKGYELEDSIFPQAYYELMLSYYQKRSDNFVEYPATMVLEEALSKHNYTNVQPEHLHQALRAFYAVSQARWHVEPDAASTLDQLSARGYRMGIVSNASDDEDVQELVNQAGLRSYFDFVITSAGAGYRKPSPRVFEQALSYWDAVPGQAAMVGDTISADVAGANALGIASVWISRRADTVENRAALCEHQPGVTIAALDELPWRLANWI